MLCAHINPKTLKKQSVKEHLINVSIMSREYGAKVSLAATGELIGILHDMGKETNEFNSYLQYSLVNPKDKTLKGTINHSTAGAKYIYDNFYSTNDPYQKLTSQIISLTICSHHGGLIDCLDLHSNDVFHNRMNTEKGIHYDEALCNFMSEFSDIININELVNSSKEEIKAALDKINCIDKSPRFRRFAMGLLLKYLFSCVIDADRYDTYLFMEDKKQQHINADNLWDKLLSIIEEKLDGYPKASKIDLLRNEISMSCKSFGKKGTGIYQLSVPTGGGKTLSSLRYAMEHAKNFNKDRIFYIIPFTTIIDQNARDIKEILGYEDIILEHHSNIIVDNEDENYKLLTERWDSPIILTTMVQFLDTLFSGGTQSTRRMHSLANSIIVFDEIQAIPIKCINMFNSAINFLSYFCNTTIVLCTATQPLLSNTEMPVRLSEDSNIVTDVGEKFEQFKRVNLIDKRIIGGYCTEALKDFVIDMMDRVNSLLMILNTKKAAKKVFNELKRANGNLPRDNQYYIFHLSTNMCPAHRIKILEEIKGKLRNERVICVSTQLIEAGVNISFSCVVRSLAGLDSIAQAAGRCNRHGERSCSDVYIVNVEEENVDKLIDIKRGQECTMRVLDEFKDNPCIFNSDLLSPKTMERYYQYYFYDRRGEMNYTLHKPNNDKTMYELLSNNIQLVDAYVSKNGRKPDLVMCQSYKTAGDNFRVIDQNTTGVIVPYKEGKKLIALINGECKLDNLKHYLKKAQQFSVNIYEDDLNKLEEVGAIAELKNGSVLALKDGYYNEDVGVYLEKQSMEFYNF